MLNYNNSEVIQCLRQYEMFSNSLRLINDPNERGMIVKQLTKLETKILELTDSVYRKEYDELVNKECGLLDDEKKRIVTLINLINQRLSYVEKRCNDHYQLTGESIDAISVMGVDTLDSLEERVKIIDKYSKNVEMSKELEGDIASLTNKISLASEKLEINKSLNVELEATFKEVLKDAFMKLNLYSLLDCKDDIKYAYSETESALDLARTNLEIAKTSPKNVLTDCEDMYNEILGDYIKFKNQISIIHLIECFENEVEDYDSLLAKRKDINEILKNINEQELLDLIMDTVNKQYSTIVMEQQDMNTYNDLVSEKERKEATLAEITNENNSEEFQAVLKVLIENERKRQEKIEEEQRRIQEEEKRKRLEIERKKQEEILRRQKIIEEARKKEMEKRTKQMLEEQQNSVLLSKKKENDVSFETMKDISDDHEFDKEDEVTFEPVEAVREQEEPKFRFDLSKYTEDVPKEEKVEEESVSPRHAETGETSFFGDKVDIEKDLFEEFKNKVDEGTVATDEERFSRLNDSMDDNKLPNVSIDEYMKNFDESKVVDTDDLFEDTSMFPTIPM